MFIRIHSTRQSFLNKFMDIDRILKFSFFLDTGTLATQVTPVNLYKLFESELILENGRRVGKIRNQTRKTITCEYHRGIIDADSSTAGGPTNYKYRRQ